MRDIGDIMIFLGETHSGYHGFAVSDCGSDVWRSEPCGSEAEARDLAAVVWERVKKYCNETDEELNGCSLGDYLDSELGDCFADDEDDFLMDLGQTQIY